MITLSISNKSFREPNGCSKTIFRDLSLRLPEDVNSVAILGRSGSGKTTLLRILAGLDINYKGEYRLSEQALMQNYSEMAKFRLENIGYITQHFDLLSDRNVEQNIMLGIPKHIEKHEKVEECLNLVGLSGFQKKKIRELSGGEAQRVAIARSIAKNPMLLLADEPSGALDVETEENILDLFDQLKAQGIKMIIATHNNTVAKRCNIRLLLKDKKLISI